VGATDIQTGPDRVFGTLRTFRRAAHFAQRWLTVAGLAGLAVCLVACPLGWLPYYFLAAAGGVAVLGPVWGLAWRRVLERAFWRGARIPVRGRPVRLPLD
jgi:hypothetical protein